MEARNGTGARAQWSQVYQGDRPRDILNLTKATEEAITQFIGFTGIDQDKKEREQFILKFEGTSEPTLTDYASTPIGTIILCPKIASVFCYVHQAQSATPVVGDWKVVAATTCT